MQYFAETMITIPKTETMDDLYLRFEVWAPISTWFMTGKYGFQVKGFDQGPMAWTIVVF